LPPGVQCTFPDGKITRSQLNHLSVLTGDADVALSALLGRLVESRQVTIPTATVSAVEASLIRTHFRGSRSLFVDALAKAQADESSARAVLATSCGGRRSSRSSRWRRRHRRRSAPSRRP